MVKNNRWHLIYNYSNITERTWNLKFKSGKYDFFTLVINGVPTGEKYEVSINACLSGIWWDAYNFVWTLVQAVVILPERSRLVFIRLPELLMVRTLKSTINILLWSGAQISQR